MPALALALAALGGLAALRLDPGHVVNWPDYIVTLAGLLWFAWQWDRLRPPLDALGKAIGRAFAQPWLSPPEPDAGACPGVAMPAQHSLTRTYSRPARLLFRYQVTDRCWHCDYARPYPSAGWRATQPARGWGASRPVPASASTGIAQHIDRPVTLRHSASGPAVQCCRACGLAPRSCLYCATGWLCPVCRHGNHGCTPQRCRAPHPAY